MDAFALAAFVIAILTFLLSVVVAFFAYYQCLVNKEDVRKIKEANAAEESRKNRKQQEKVARSKSKGRRYWWSPEIDEETKTLIVNAFEEATKSESALNEDSLFETPFTLCFFGESDSSEGDVSVYSVHSTPNTPPRDDLYTYNDVEKVQHLSTVRDVTLSMLPEKYLSAHIMVAADGFTVKKVNSKRLFRSYGKSGGSKGFEKVLTCVGHKGNEGERYAMSLELAIALFKAVSQGGDNIVKHTFKGSGGGRYFDVDSSWDPSPPEFPYEFRFYRSALKESYEVYF